MAERKDIWKCLPSFLIPPVGLILLGELKWALISLGLIPLFFICWGLSLLFSDKRLREIDKHMTEGERKQFKELTEGYGRKVGLFFAAPMGASYFILSYIVGVKKYVYYIVAFGVILLIWLPSGLGHRKRMNRFALSTRYAKQKGWQSEP
jgi:hypothetical protein